MNNEIDRHNLKTLTNNKQGGLLSVDREGKLQTIRVSFFAREKSSERAAREEKVKETISKTLSSLNAHIDRNKENIHSFREYLSPHFQKNGSIGSLKPSLYSRKMIREDSSLAFCVQPKNSLKVDIGGDKLHIISQTFETLNNDEIPLKTLKINLRKSQHNDNLVALLQRRKGEKLVVREGKLVKIRGLQEKINYRLHRNEEQKRVQEVVSKMMRRIKAENVQEGQVAYALILKHLFNEEGALGRLSSAIFDRSCVKEGSGLELLLMKELSEMRTSFSEKLKSMKRAKGPKSFERRKRRAIRAFLELSLAEFKFTQMLGKDFERVSDGGSGGARYGRDRFGKKILVSKPADEGPHGVNNPQWYSVLKNLVGEHPCHAGNSEALCEEDSYLLSEFLESGLVPPTVLRSVYSKTFVKHSYKQCSHQMFVSGCTTLRDYIGMPYWMHNLPRPILEMWFNRPGGLKNLVNKIPPSLLEEMGKHNFLSGDTDCHLENILIHITPNYQPTPIDTLWQYEGTSPSEDELNDLVSHLFEKEFSQKLLLGLFKSHVDEDNTRYILIKHDGGNTFPHSHPIGWRSTRFKHFFEVFPGCDQPLSEDTKNNLKTKKAEFSEFLKKKALRDLKNKCSQTVINNYFVKRKNSDQFNEWLINKEKNKKTRKKIASDLAAESIKWEAEHPSSEEVMKIKKHHKRYFNRQLKRIKGTVKTRQDSWEVLEKVGVNEGATLRKVLKVRNKFDFKHVLSSYHFS